MNKPGIKRYKCIPVAVGIPIAIQCCFYDTGFGGGFFLCVCVINANNKSQMHGEALAVNKLFSS